jgi:hypothetical protein
MRNLNLIADASGKIGIGFIATNHTDNLVLVANTAKTYTIPTGASVLLFSGTAPFWVNWYTTAVVPSGDVTSGAGQCLNPMLRGIPDDVTAISIISAVDCKLSIEALG